MNEFTSPEGPDAIERMAEHHLKRLIFEIQNKKLVEFKLDHLMTNPDDFLSEHLSAVSDKDRPEVIACIRQTVWKGFFKSIIKGARDDREYGEGGAPRWL